MPLNLQAATLEMQHILSQRAYAGCSPACIFHVWESWHAKGDPLATPSVMVVHNDDRLTAEVIVRASSTVPPALDLLREAHAYQDRRAGCWVGEGGI